VAQLVARLLWEQEAEGSSPFTPTKQLFLSSYLVGNCFFVPNGIKSVVVPAGAKHPYPKREEMAGKEVTKRNLHPSELREKDIFVAPRALKNSILNAEAVPIEGGSYILHCTQGRVTVSGKQRFTVKRQV
jgi:hypothetical protein